MLVGVMYKEWRGLYEGLQKRYERFHKWEAVEFFIQGFYIEKIDVSLKNNFAEKIGGI